MANHMIKPTTGMMVWTTDGKALGTITEVKEDRFRLDTTEGAAHWLNCADLDAVEDGRARLSFEAAALPEHETTPVSESVLPTEEKQRIVMLQQLAEQRRQIREDGIATPEADATIGEPIEAELERRTDMAETSTS